MRGLACGGGGVPKVVQGGLGVGPVSKPENKTRVSIYGTHAMPDRLTVPLDFDSLRSWGIIITSCTDTRHDKGIG